MERNVLFECTTIKYLLSNLSTSKSVNFCIHTVGLKLDKVAVKQILLVIDLQLDVGGALGRRQVPEYHTPIT